MGIQSQINRSLRPEGGNGIRDFVLEDIDKFFVFIGDFLLSLNLCDDLIFSTDCREYADLVTIAYKYMRIYL